MSERSPANHDTLVRVRKEPETTTKTLLKGATARQIAVEGLRSAILSGELAPGERLVEPRLADQFGITRASARAAMDDLIAEDLLERIPNRGAQVRAFSLAEAIEILECRQVLEGLIAARAAERVTEDQAAELRYIGAAMKAAVAEEVYTTYAELNIRLHALVAEIAEQDIASNLISRFRSQIVRHQFRLSNRPGRPQVSLGQHLAIIERVASGDGPGAESAAREHIGSVISALTSGTAS